MNDRKDRRIIFRVSEDEYLRLKQLCLATRTRSISDLVRNAVDYWVSRAGGQFDAALQGGLQELNARVAALTARIDRLVGSRNETA